MADPWTSILQMLGKPQQQSPQLAQPMPGQMHMNPLLTPQVPPGAPRPFTPGQWLDNPDGSWSSEITMTIAGNPRLNNGLPTVIPSLWIVNGKPMRATSEDQAAEWAAQSGLSFPSYSSLAEADAASTNRETKWQGIAPQDASQVPALWKSGPPLRDK